LDPKGFGRFSEGIMDIYGTVAVNIENKN